MRMPGRVVERGERGRRGAVSLGSGRFRLVGGEMVGGLWAVGWSGSRR